MASYLQPPLPVFDLCAFIFHFSLCSSISPPILLALCIAAGCTFGFSGPSAKQRTRLIILLRSSPIG